AVAVMIAGTIAGFLLVRQDASWFYAIIPGDMAGGRDPAASREALIAPLRGGPMGGDMLGAFAAFLFTHNAQIAILSFALGFAFGLPTMLLIAYNGAMLGAFLALYLPHGLGLELGGWLAIHGTTELFAIALAGAAGFRIGLATAFPGAATRADAAVAAGRAAGTLMAGVVVMLAIAGLLEGIGRQTIEGSATRYLIGAVMLAGWCAYLYLPRRADG
ncbi:MAG: stage II sporulation protein M, partial [Sphingomonas sp.]